MHRCLGVILPAFLVFLSPCVVAQQWLESAELAKKPAEGYPEDIAERLKKSQVRDESTLRELTAVRDYIIEKGKTWDQRQVRVAFDGGSTRLHEHIERAAQKWISDSGVESLVLDFGKHPETGHYRMWSTDDIEYAAEIRITFNEAGYWSAIGIDAASPRLFAPNEASMNYADFLRGLPTDWEAVVLHEFGHALGFHHEHQSSRCAQEFRWERGANPQTQPSIYDVFNAWQGWGRTKVDVNMKPYLAASGDILAPGDRESIMFYRLPAIIFLDATTATCYIPKENATLSSEDLSGFGKAYGAARNQSASLLALERAASTQLSAALSDSSMDGDSRRLLLEKQAQYAINTTLPPGNIAAPEGTDTWITTKVKSELLLASGVKGEAIVVTTRNGVVELSGVVESENTIGKIVALARAIEGVKGVEPGGVKVTQER